MILTLKIGTFLFFPFLLNDTPAHADVPSYKVCIQKDEWFRRHHLDKLQIDRQIDEQNDSNTCPTILLPGKKKQQELKTCNQ